MGSSDKEICNKAFDPGSSIQCAQNKAQRKRKLFYLDSAKEHVSYYSHSY